MLVSGPFALDPDNQRLTRRGVEVPLSGQPMAILSLLMAAPGRIVTRAELKRALWPNCERIDTERRLNTAMRALREALRDAAGTPRYVETIRGRGYRWVARDQSAVKRRARWPIASVAAAGLLCTIAACTILLPNRTTAPLTHEQQARYWRAVAATSPQAATAELTPLLKVRPDYAPARLLNASFAMRQWRDAPTPQTLAASRHALALARAIDAQGADVATMEAELAIKSALDWRGAERLYRAVLDREPDNVEARRGFAWLLLNTERSDEALTQVESLLANGTLTDAMRADLGWLLLRARRPDLALALCDAGRLLPNLLACRHTALVRTGDSGGARRVALAFMQSVGAGKRDVAYVRDGDAQEGYRRFLRWRAAQYASDQAHWFQRAQAEAEAGWSEAALNHLEYAFAVEDPSRFKLATTPEFDRLRGDRRFQRLLRIVQPT